MFENPFSFEGRIRRMEYGLSILIYTVVYFIMVFGIAPLGTLGAIVMILIMIPAIWFSLAQGAKRCHDLGRSGWFLLIPFYGLVMLFVEGDSGRNEYGADPKRPEDEYNTALDSETLDGHMNTNN